MGERYCQNLTVNLTRCGSSFSTTPLRLPHPLKQRLKIAKPEPPLSARNGGKRLSLVVRLSLPEVCIKERQDEIFDDLLFLSVSCESSDRPTEFDKLPYIEYLVEIFQLGIRRLRSTTKTQTTMTRWKCLCDGILPFYLESEGFNQYHMQQKD